MRVSTDQTDEGFKNYSSDYDYHVTVDGVEVKEVTTADSDKGYVLKANLPLRADVDGKIVMDEVYGDVVITAKLKGL